ncbi:MAG: helix-turn-helix domain-containing protein [Candidatus Ornithomonoglobus sp.]
MKIKSQNYDYAPIGQRIKNIRKKRKFTQEYVAEKLNVSNQHISDIERGLNGMSIPSLMELCRILDVDADYILFGTMTRQESNPINNIINKMTPQQSMHAEEILTAYAKSCGII